MKAKYIGLGGAFLAVSVLTAMTATNRLIPGKPALAPMADIQFCKHYPDDCKKTAGDEKDAGVFRARVPAVRFLHPSKRED